ncbi:MAG TPA: hypothetical protein DD723_07775 [Candidatus Omnitrophica bacterium]|nr:MAG: hypothetical protein A2Z81_04235 [Omnitrophica WOR_2 bacterium GWA2_45_18]HBR15424.1 hypothetical protein [Candidatus Omnitrophota bacterium]
MERITWEENLEGKFLKILEGIPDLIRGIAETRVFKKAEQIITGQNRTVITEKDMVDAFFAETPPGFKTAMKNSLQELHIDYKKFGHQ